MTNEELNELAVEFAEQHPSLCTAIAQLVCERNDAWDRLEKSDALVVETVRENDALIRERDAATSRVRELEECLREVVPFIEKYMARVDEGHVHGPDNHCDYLCMCASNDEALLHTVKSAIAKAGGNSNA